MSRFLVGHIAEIQGTHGTRVILPEGPKLAVFLVNERYWAVQLNCPHMMAVLNKWGEVLPNLAIIECKMHGFAYDPESGKNVRWPEGESQTEPLKTYPLTEEDGSLYLELP